MLLLAYNHKNGTVKDFQLQKINKAFGFSLKEPRYSFSHSLQPLFHSTSEIPLKYSRASSSCHSLAFIVPDIKRGNYLISDL